MPLKVVQRFTGRRTAWLCAVPFFVFLAACGGTTPSDSTATAPDTESKDAASPTEAKASGPPELTVVSAEQLAEHIKAASGKAVVVNYWATWCPPCVHELPELAKFSKSINKDKVAFISVSVDHPETIDDALLPFLEERPQPYPILVLDAMPGDLDGIVDIGDWAGAVPGTFVYSPEGTLVKFWNEEVTEALLLESVRPWTRG